MIIGWRIWYEIETGYRVYSSAETSWLLLPDDGVLALRTYENGLRRNGDNEGIRLQGADYYFMASGPRDVIIGCDYDRRGVNVCREIEGRYPGASVKRGKWTDHVVYDEAYRDMLAANRWD